jgi:hypothetical protein
VLAVLRIVIRGVVVWFFDGRSHREFERRVPVRHLLWFLRGLRRFVGWAPRRRGHLQRIVVGGTDGFRHSRLSCDGS